MMKRVVVPVFVLLVICLATAAAAPNPVDGRWRGKLAGSFDIVLVMQVQGSKLSGMVHSPIADSPIEEGKVKGNEFSFSVTTNGNKIPYQGKVQGDSLNLVVKFQNREVKGTLARIDPNGPLPLPMKPHMTEFWEPVPEKVDPGPYAGIVAPPSDAVVLFNGKDLSAWKGSKGEALWEVGNGAFTVKKGTGDIETKQAFEDYQLHIEWMIPAGIQGEGQSRGNSGVFMQGTYELQVLDSYNNPTYVNGQAGSIYKQTAPLVNAMRKPGEWNVYDVIYTAPRFRENGSLLYPARITVIHNGVVIQNNTEIKGDTPYIGLPKYTKHGKGPIRLQDHGDPSQPISFRNIWLREL